MDIKKVALKTTWKKIWTVLVSLLHPQYRVTTSSRKIQPIPFTVYNFLFNPPELILIFKNGKIHCDYGPAFFSLWDCFEAYYDHGKMHRLVGPAITHQDGTENYYLFGQKAP